MIKYSGFSEKVAAIFVIICIVAVIFMAIPVETVDVHVSGRSWHTWVELVEDYETTEYVCHAQDGERVCGFETTEHTRVLNRRDLHGLLDDEISYPDPFVRLSFDQRNRYGDTFTIEYTADDGSAHKNNVSKGAYWSYVIGTECRLWKNGYGFVIVDKCAQVYGR